MTVSGTTEDFMGKTLATDAHNAAGCVAEGGMDTVYRIDLAQRSLISADLIAPFAAKMALRSTSCSDGEVAYCAASSSYNTPLEPGSYYLWIDAEDANAKGNYTLTVERTKLHYQVMKPVIRQLLWSLQVKAERVLLLPASTLLIRIMRVGVLLQVMAMVLTWSTHSRPRVDLHLTSA